jgi:type VI secretion system protein ImpB
VAIQDELPQSRITLKYRTTIEGEEEDVKLPMRTMVLGDFSKGSSKDRAEDLDERRLRTLDGTNRVDDLMKDMNISLSMSVPNRIKADSDTIQVELPVTGMKSFEPGEVAKHIPQVKALMLLKTLISEMQSNIDNRKDLRKIIQELCANPEAMEKTLAELKAHEGSRLPTMAEFEQARRERDDEGQG